ncbi:DUF4041 domain-containing protein (plasmid) [Streptomyces sp. BI20]|uniref:DUF4041 domain-containing protein n=1 Tax=Streptomyces sp. BI20 TaxID=3403460 RepID=UPI003C768C37
MPAPHAAPHMSGPVPSPAPSLLVAPPGARQRAEESARAGGALFGRRRRAEEAAADADARARDLAAELAGLRAEVHRLGGLTPAEITAEAQARDAARRREEERRAEEETALDRRLREKVDACSARLAERTAEAERRAAEAESRAAHVEGRITDADARLAEAARALVATRDEVMLQEAGIYSYRHPLQDAVAYTARLAELRDHVKTLTRNGEAVQGATGWTVDGSLAKGRKMVQDFSKLMLRAYNAEADNAVRSMRPHRLASLTDRLEKSRETIAKLGATMQIRISPAYHRLRLRELELTADHLAKEAEEKERRRELRARQREEEKLAREIERERARLDKERRHYASALARLGAEGAEADPAARAELEARLAEIEGSLSAVTEREANARAGYVYVISNIGAFGDRMVKIGMTRRLEPMDRVHELGDASVPFRFDVHALIFSDDAVGLEQSLHRAFEDRRVNRVNRRREFFHVTPTEVREALRDLAGQHLLEFREDAEAPEWRAGRPPHEPGQDGPPPP